MEQAIMSGWGYLNTEAAPVKISKPSFYKYFVAKWAPNNDGYKHTFNISLHFMK